MDFVKKIRIFDSICENYAKNHAYFCIFDVIFAKKHTVCASYFHILRKVCQKNDFFDILMFIYTQNKQNMDFVKKIRLTVFAKIMPKITHISVLLM